MVEFEYQPWKKVVVHDVFEQHLDQFLITHSLGAEVGGIGQPLNWVDGIVFDHTIISESEDVIKEQIEGRLHWISLMYGFMDEYKEEFVMPGKVTIKVFNVSNNILFKKMAEWIKENAKKGWITT